MEHKTYKTQAVCSKQIDFDYDEQKRMYNLKFIGGCNGNLKAIGKLCEGKPMEEIMNIFQRTRFLPEKYVRQNSEDCIKRA